MDYTKLIKETCDEVRDLLIEKNTAYGHSVFKPIDKFGIRIPPIESILARMADKEARIANKGFNDQTEDTLKDLIGYMILLYVVVKIQEQNKDE